MSEALQSMSVHFDDPPRAPQTNAARPEGDAPRAIAATLRAAGIDAPGSLYNEAIELARDGHLGQAASRLQMLICLDPDDADAQLLLARVNAAQNRPAEALARLDAAVAAGAIATAGFRDQLEAAIRAERSSDEEHRSRLAAREQGEVKALRQEARQLRSETVRLESELMMAVDRERLWKYLAIGSSVIGTAIILAMLVVGGSADTAPPTTLAATTAAATTAAATTTAATEADATEAAASDATPSVAETTTGRTTAGTNTSATTAPTPAPVKPAPTAAAKALATTSTHSHVVGSGDTLYKLASRYYGDSSQWTRIRDANRASLKGGIDLTLGQKLVIP